MTTLDLAQARQIITEHLTTHWSQVIPTHHSIQEIYEYAVFPPGKLFRPLLAHTLAMDLIHPSAPKGLEHTFSDHSYFASFLEIHHAYTLVHDDLPCMDNEEWRRDKLATHRRYGEWQALLIGDGLLNASYQILARLQTPYLGLLLRFVTHNLGAKGLIQGQVLDLSLEMVKSFPLCLLTHELKTSRLIQVALVGSYALIPPGDFKSQNLANAYRMTRELYKLGKHLGLFFQFLDDLTELRELTAESHEAKVNPFLNFPEESLRQLTFSGQQVEKTLKRYELNHLQLFLADYLQGVHKALANSLEVIEKRIRESLDKGPSLSIEGKRDLHPLMAFLNRIGHLN